MPILLSYRVAFAALVTGSFLLSGCTSNPPLYYWPGYDEQVYNHFKHDTTPAQQIGILEGHLQKARSKSMTPAPGYYAHLGMLYSLVGDDDKAMNAFDSEQRQFPEAKPFLSFLLKQKQEPNADAIAALPATTQTTKREN